MKRWKDEKDGKMEREEKFSGKKMRQVTSKDFKHFELSKEEEEGWPRNYLCGKREEKEGEEGKKRIATS